MADVLKDPSSASPTSTSGTLNAIYSLPNIIMVLIGGIIIDRIGTRKSTLLFARDLCMVGAAVTVAVGRLSGIGMAGGRLIFGLGSESLIVAVTTALAKLVQGAGSFRLRLRSST